MLNLSDNQLWNICQLQYLDQDYQQYLSQYTIVKDYYRRVQRGSKVYSYCPWTV
jgi:hypothetical protein